MVGEDAVVEEAVAQAADAPANLKSFLQAMDGLGNVPRNGKKFKNFVRNSLRMRSEPTIDQLWDHLEARQQKARAEMEEALAKEFGAALESHRGCRRTIGPKTRRPSTGTSDA